MTAPIMTYSSLFSTVQTYLDRATDTALSSQIPNLISLGEVRCAREIKTLGFKRVYTGSFLAQSSVYQKPARWRETINFQLGTGSGGNTFNTLYPRSYEFCRAYWPDPTVTDSTQPPVYYADYDYNSWLVVPTPYTGYPFEVSMYEKPLPLSVENQQNWLTEICPDLILYATLMEAEPFIKNYELLQVWQANYNRAVAALMGEDMKRRSDASLKRTEGE